MSLVGKLLSPSHVLVDLQASSKKRLFEQAGLLFENHHGIARSLVFDSLFARERLGSTDDCGFSPFSIDEKPNHGSPDFARDVAFQKIANRVQGTRLAAEKLGVG